MMPSLMEIGQTMIIIMKILEMINKTVAAASKNAKKNGKEMYLISTNSWS